MKALSPEGKKSRHMHPVQLFCALDPEKPVTHQEKTKMIMFACLQCGSPLKISEITPRILKCEYCDTDQYIPDALWRNIHPIPKKRTWFIRWE